MLYPNINEERTRIRMTWAGLAKALKIDIKTLSNWRNGKTAFPSNKLLEMADMFGCTTDYLLGRTDRRTHDHQMS